MSALAADQVALLAAVAERERTAAELATALGGRPGETEHRLRVLCRLGLAAARVEVCPLCQDVSGRRVYRASDAGLLALAESPLLKSSRATG